MAWFAGGVTRYNDVALAWSTGASLYASVIGGGTSANYSPTLTTLNQFVGPGSINPSLDVMGDAKDLALPVGARPAPQWANAQLRFILDQQTVWTTPATGQDFAGVVVHEGPSTDPATSHLWLFEPSVAPNQQTLGGDVVWGGASGNLVLSLNAKYVTPLGKPTKGTAEHFRKLANAWADASSRVGFALCRNDVYTSNNGQNFEYVQDALNNGQLFVNGCGPTEENCPEALLANRLPFGFNGLVAQFRVDPSFQVLYDSTKGTWTAGQNMAAVMAFMYDTTYNPATARILAYDILSPVLLTAAATNVVYGANNNVIADITLV